jgi:hypothetical protein
MMKTKLPILLFTLLLCLSVRGATISNQVFSDTQYPCRDTTYENCQFRCWGWGVYATGVSVTCYNCYFYGGGLFAFVPKSVSVTHCTFDGQNYGFQGAVIWGDGSATSASIYLACNDFEREDNGIQLAGIKWDPNVSIFNNRITGGGRSDQISVYNSTGTPWSLICVMSNLVVTDTSIPHDPDAMAIQAGDGDPETGAYSSYVGIYNNTVINGDGGGICLYYPNGNTSVVEENIVIGSGEPNANTCGINVTYGAGEAYNNTVDWWDTFTAKSNNLTPEYEGNKELSQVTLGLEMEYALRWEIQMINTSQWIGCSFVTPPTIQWK